MLNKMIILCIFLSSFCVTEVFGADSINGRLGVTGNIGFIVPADNHAFGVRLNSDTGFIVGGGIIYGLMDNVAAELTVTRAEYDTDTVNANRESIVTTNISVGAQYRLETPVPKLHLFAGGGLEVIMFDVYLHNVGTMDTDTTFGAHVKGGVDYFIKPQLALTSEVKGTVAITVDLTNNGRTVGDFDPCNFSMTFGLRYFFN